MRGSDVVIAAVEIVAVVIAVAVVVLVVDAVFVLRLVTAKAAAAVVIVAFGGCGRALRHCLSLLQQQRPPMPDSYQCMCIDSL